ncbi:MAG: YceI family protein [Bacteroidetes bacterium]|nr:YceI family protein [Bacteroidota bacterium]MCB9227576.1 YceI family protein [Chitinophagales bacterium]
MKKLNLSLLSLILIVFVAFTSCKSNKPVEEEVVVEEVVEEGISGTFDINTETSKLEWLGKKVTGEHYGTINFQGGNFTLEHNQVVGGVATVDMTSIVVSDLTDAEMNAKLTGHLNSEDFFNTANFPTATLEFTQGATANELIGKLTIKDITQDVVINANLADVEGQPTITGTMTVDRTLYDIKYGSGKFFDNLGDKAINDEFKLSFTVVSK